MSTASDRYFSLMMMMRQKKNVCWQRHKNDISPLTDASYLMFVISYNSLRMSTHLCGIEVECERTRLILKHYFNCSKHKHRPSNPVRRMTKLCFISFFFFIQYIYKKKGGVGGGRGGNSHKPPSDESCGWLCLLWHDRRRAYHIVVNQVWQTDCHCESVWRCQRVARYIIVTVGLVFE